MRSPSRALATGLSLVALLALSPQARAYTYETRARVVDVVDGDTFTADVDGDGAPDQRIRITGIQATELQSGNREADECHADRATAYLKLLLPRGEVVTLRATDAGSSSRTRPLRYVRTDRLGDIGMNMIQRGLAFAFPHRIENEMNASYLSAQRETAALAARDTLWDPEACGPGPAPGARPVLWAQPDADGPDATVARGEWVKIRNDGTEPLVLTGSDGAWILRDSALNYFRSWPAGTIVQPGATLTVWTRTVPPGESGIAWGAEHPILNNMGDGVFLVDPDGDVRAHFAWPCLPAAMCPAPPADVEITANYDAEGSDAENPAGEWVNITNRGSAALPLGRLVLRGPQNSAFEFGEHATLAPGARLRISVGAPPSSGAVAGWGKSRPILANGGGRVVLQTYDRILVARHSWPCGSCPRAPDVRLGLVGGTGGLAVDAVTVTNYGSSSVDLRDWLIDAARDIDFFDSRVLAPGARISVGLSQPLGSLAGGRARLLTPYRVQADCLAWGAVSCRSS